MNCISVLLKDYLPFSFIQILRPDILFEYTDINIKSKNRLSIWPLLFLWWIITIFTSWLYASSSRIKPLENHYSIWSHNITSVTLAFNARVIYFQRIILTTFSKHLPARRCQLLWCVCPNHQAQTLKQKWKLCLPQIITAGKKHADFA